MNSKRLAVFAASRQWADAVKVVSRGTSCTSATFFIQYITEFKSVFLTVIIRQINIYIYIFLNYTQFTRGEAEKMPLYTVHYLPHHAHVMTTF